jgi:hypothetical protein
MRVYSGLRRVSIAGSIERILYIPGTHRSIIHVRLRPRAGRHRFLFSNPFPTTIARSHAIYTVLDHDLSQGRERKYDAFC